jgi:hypothetical protein
MHGGIRNAHNRFAGKWGGKCRLNRVVILKYILN